MRQSYTYDSCAEFGRHLAQLVSDVHDGFDQEWGHLEPYLFEKSVQMRK